MYKLGMWIMAGGSLAVLGLSVGCGRQKPLAAA